MVWRILHYPAGIAPSREYSVRARSLKAAKRELATVRGDSEWTLR